MSRNTVSKYFRLPHYASRGLDQRLALIQQAHTDDEDGLLRGSQILQEGRGSRALRGAKLPACGYGRESLDRRVKIRQFRTRAEMSCVHCKAFGISAAN